MKETVLVCALIVVSPLAVFGQTVTSIGNSNVEAADDFATRAFQDPWDMNQRTDLGWFLHGTDGPQPNITNITFGGGVFSGQSTNGDPSVFLLESGNPFAARLGKTGLNYPIAADTYKVIAWRMTVTTSSFYQFFWNRSTIYDNTINSTQGLLSSAGSRIYLLDLSTAIKQPITGNSIPWSGSIGALRFDPTTRSAENFSLDWARLVSIDTSLCRTVNWINASGNVDIHLIQASNDADLGPIALSVANNSASAGCSATGTGHNFYAGALAPGTYKVAVVNAGGNVAPQNISNDTWVVNDIPTLAFTSPSEEGSSDDFATTVLSNPWDMNALSDIDLMNFVDNPQITTLPLETPAGVSLGNQTVFLGTSVGEPSTGFGDPQLGLMWNPGRGASARIDPLKYRILTLEMGVPNLPRNINNGSIARITWRVAGDTLESVTEDIIFNSRAGANVLDKIIVDMADRTVLPIEQGATTGWVRGSSSNPGLDIFRVDPHEYSPATQFFVKRVKLAAFDRTARFYTIRWNYNDSGGGTVDLYYDSNGTGFNGTLIAAGIDATAGMYNWDSQGVSLPSAFIYAIFRDSFAGGSNENRVYAKWPIVLTVNAAPQISVNRSTLNFGVANGLTRTSSQIVRVTTTGTGSPAWCVTNPQPSIFSVSPATGTGTGTFTVSLVNQPYALGQTASTTLTVGACSGSTIENTAAVNVVLRSHVISSGPTGVMDTPAEGATVRGSIAVTGWAVDDVDISQIAIWRDPVASAGETAPRVFIGTATRVDDSRTDIAATFPDVPFQYRAGWGYLLLTNFLPNGGTGTYRLHAYVTDAEGNEALIGSKTITGVNSTSDVPFGAIDTPAQGATIGGTSYNNFGWVLVRGPWRADPPNGSVTAFIDSVAVGSPGGWAARSDLTALFPQSQYPGITNALGVFTFNTTTYANGVHTIFWIVTANNGRADGVGSRFFTIFNGSSGPLTTGDMQANVVEAPAARAHGRALGTRAAEWRVIDTASPVRVVSGLAPVVGPTFRSGAAAARRKEARTIDPGPTGTRVVASRSTERLKIQLGDARRDGADYEAYEVIEGRLRPLPVGANFDERGVFYWLPALGVAGPHDFVFIRDGRTIPVRVIVNPATPSHSSASRFVRGLFLSHD